MTVTVDIEHPEGSRVICTPTAREHEPVELGRISILYSCDRSCQKGGAMLWVVGIVPLLRLSPVSSERSLILHHLHGRRLVAMIFKKKEQYA